MNIPSAFKSTGTGVEIQLLKTLFTEKEAEMYLNLNAEPSNSP